MPLGGALAVRLDSVYESLEIYISLGTEVLDCIINIGIP
jgi:hypothetical protein